MKFLLLFALCLSCSNLVMAQDASEGQMPPDLVILKINWKRAVSRPRLYTPSLADASRSGVPDRTRTIWQGRNTPFPPGGKPPYFYTYTLELRNNGTQTIKAVAWNHIFTDPGDHRELASHTFISYDKLTPGSSRTFSVDSASPPSNVVSREGLEKDKRSPFLERAVITCVLYKDGTLWESPGAGGGCEELRKREARKKLRKM